jgi:LCP family protein required for cell wall assembly
MSAESPSRPPRPGVRFALRFLLAGIIVLVVAGTAVATVIRHEAEVTVAILDDGPEAKTGNALSKVKSGAPQTILLVGDDHRYKTDDGTPTPKGDPTRSDTMILLRLDPDANATTMLSLPRDLILADGTGGAKLNASYGNGPEQLIETLKRILSTPSERFEINHFVSVRFTAFAKAVNKFGCFYADIDRKYFNDNSGPGDNYATIDVDAGYQRLCGEDSLDYVRFRHLDSDLVREARQTNYLAEARAQIAGSTLFNERNDLLRAIRPYIRTDKMSANGLLGVIKLAVNVVGHPTQRVPLDVTFTEGGDVRTTPASLALAAQQFLHPDRVPGGASRAARKAAEKAAEDEAAGTTTGPAPAGTTTGGSAATPKKAKKAKKAKKGKKAKRSGSKLPPTMFANPAAARTVIASDIAPKLRGLPIYYPKLMASRARYPENQSRQYDIQSPGGMAYPWSAYRLVVLAGEPGGGQYYGVEGTTWKDPPILQLADDEESLGGRSFQVQYDGKKIRRLMWKAPKGTYWVTNTLNNSMSNDEMRALARSLTRYGG